MDLSVRLGSLQLKNPIVVSAGPWARDAQSIQRCIDQGAGAVTTETITLEANPNISPRMYVHGEQTLNTKMFSDLHLEQWEGEFERIKKGDCKLICSIWGNSASEISYLAAKATHMGADAVEVSMSSPIRNRAFSMEPKHVNALLCAAVKAAAGIPVIAKLSYEACNSVEFTREVYAAGVRIVSAIDGLKGLAGVDIEQRRSVMPTYGGFNGSSIHPLALATTATLKQYTPFYICSCGGTLNYEQVLEFIMLGASCVALASVIQINGYGAISRVIADCVDFLQTHGCSSVSELQGVALPSLHPFEDIEPQPLCASAVKACAQDSCNVCTNGCLYDAISRQDAGEIFIDPKRCSGCGHCVARCPEQLLMMEWNRLGETR